MKNSLELQIYGLIKKANQHYIQQQLNISLKIYSQALVVFQENRNYNNQVSPHFQPLLYSLIGLTCFKSNSYDQAEHFLSKSLSFNPHDSLTLIRRSHLYCQMKRIPEALQDVQKAHLCDPDSKNVKSLLNLIEEAISELQIGQQKERLSINLKGIMKYVDQSQQNSQTEEENLSFLNLRKIDRVSISVTQNKVSKKLELFQNQNQTDQIEDFSNKQVQIQSQNQNVLSPVTIIRKNSIKKKSTIGSSIRSLIHNSNMEQQRSNEKSTPQDFNSIKSIENKIIKRSSVQFLEPSTFEQLPSKVPVSTQNLTQRKSCLRISKLKFTQEQAERRSSSFMNIKNIDGVSKQLLEHIKHKQEESISLNKQREEESKQFSESDEQQDNKNEHCIYGSKSKTSKALKCIENMGSWSNKDGSIGEGKKRSILKKSSVIYSEKQTRYPNKEVENKKSVCFENSYAMQIKQNSDIAPI